MSRFLILCLLLLTTARAQSYAEIRTHILSEEGYSAKPYLLRGQWHIGLGHRLARPSGPLTHRQTEALFAKDLKVACDAAYSDIKTFSRQPKQVRIMLCALSYNLGPSGFHDFYLFRAAIDRFDYRAAARELRISLWSSQLPSRAIRYQDILLSATH